MAVKKARRPTAPASNAGARAPKKNAARRAPPSVSARPAATAAAAKSTARPPAATGAPNAIGAWHHHLDYTSHDVASLKRFYTQVLGFTRVIEEPKVGYLTIHTTPTTSLGFMAPMPGPPEQWRPPGEPALYFFVENVDKVHKDLVAKGVAFQQPPTDMPWGHRLAVCRDPEGRMICLAQDASRG